MRRKRYTAEQIVRKLREGDRMLNEGTEVVEVLRYLEVSESSWARWRAQYGGMRADEAKRLKELERENARLKKLLAEAELEKAMLKELAEGNFSERFACRSRVSTGRRNASRVRHARSTTASCAPSCV
jgi:putative transposase